MPIRRNAATLSAADRSAYVQAVLSLKANGLYDPFVQLHANSMGAMPMQAHQSPMFLPWHREFLKNFESALSNTLGRTYALPYWDWAADEPNPLGSNIWDDDFMGGNGMPVTSGPFRQGQWTLLGGGSLVRRFGQEVPSLPSYDDVDAVLAVDVYDASPWDAVILPMGGYQSFRDQLEGWLSKPGEDYVPQLHNRVHVWVGGTMDVVATSPNDPVFWLHHANVDRIWRKWQLDSASSSYLPASGMPGLDVNSQMLPWIASVTPSSVLSTVQLGYIYDTDIQRTPPFGGPHGSSFDDSNGIQAVPPVISGVTVTYDAAAITSVTVNYANNPSVPHGKQVGYSVTMPLGVGERIVTVKVGTKKQNDKTGVVAIGFTTSTTATYMYGQTEGATGWNEWDVEPGMLFSGFCGRASNRVYSLGIVSMPNQ